MPSTSASGRLRVAPGALFQFACATTPALSDAPIARRVAADEIDADCARSRPAVSSSTLTVDRFDGCELPPLVPVTVIAACARRPAPRPSCVDVPPPVTDAGRERDGRPGRTAARARGRRGPAKPALRATVTENVPCAPGAIVRARGRDADA